MSRGAFQIATGCVGAMVAAAMLLPMQQCLAAGEKLSGRSWAAVHHRVIPLRESPIFQSWVDKMDLSDDQQEQISPIVQRMFADINMLRLDEHTVSDDHVEEIRFVRIKASRQIRSFLTPKQLPQFEELQKQLGHEIARSPGGRPYIESIHDFAPDPSPLPEPAPEFGGPLLAPAPAPEAGAIAGSKDGNGSDLGQAPTGPSGH